MKINEKNFFGNAYPWYRTIFLTIMITLTIGEIAAYRYGITDRIRFDFLGRAGVVILMISIILRRLYITIKNHSKKRKGEGIEPSPTNNINNRCT